MHLLHSTELVTDLIDLPEEEAHHALHVLRLPVGTRVGLLDGKGTYAEAEISAIAKRSCTVRVLRKEMVPAERVASIHLAVAPTKQMERFEWFLEKATEIGVDRVTPLLTHRTERSRLRMDRLEKVVVAAMKQSQRRWLPRLDELTPIKAVSSNLLGTPEGERPVQKFFGWCEGSPLELAAAYDPRSDALLMIGPEGDFTVEEAEMLGTQGFQAIGLGHARLRTETAAIAACAWMNFAQHRR